MTHFFHFLLWSILTKGDNLFFKFKYFWYFKAKFLIIIKNKNLEQSYIFPALVFLQAILFLHAMRELEGARERWSNRIVLFHELHTKRGKII